MAEEEGLSIAIDYAPTKDFKEAVPDEEFVHEAKNFARATAVRHMPVYEDNPLLTTTGETATAQKLKRNDKLMYVALGIGFLVGISLVITVVYLRKR